MFYSENFEGAWWLCHEIDLAENGFELGVLFDCPFREVKICAADVLLEERDNFAWSITNV